MFKEMSLMFYNYIHEAEVMFLRYYKIDPITLIGHMPLLDLQMYVKTIQQKVEKEKHTYQNKDIMKALKAVCDYLNFVFYKD